MAAEEGSSGGGGGGGEDRNISPAPTKSGGSGAAKFLAGMPSRCNFSGSVSSSLGGLRVYVCEHSTDPPEGQVIKTDLTNILIRHLQLNKQKSEAKDGGTRTPGESSRVKRSAARSLDVNNSAKRPNLGTSSGSSAYGEAISGFSQHTLQAFTVERLRALLRQSGLSTKGKKDELIARLREAQG
uniref:SAP domain-containing protein n=1 Tax=Arundo donax TaxID=35708 RepID=A0A0A9FUT3_ARUDO